jgi:hypothetical protein
MQASRASSMFIFAVGKCVHTNLHRYQSCHTNINEFATPASAATLQRLQVEESMGACTQSQRQLAVFSSVCVIVVSCARLVNLASHQTSRKCCYKQTAAYSVSEVLQPRLCFQGCGRAGCLFVRQADAGGGRDVGTGATAATARENNVALRFIRRQHRNGETHHLMSELYTHRYRSLDHRSSV